MQKWTMREVCEELGKERTTIQGWVKDILKKPTGEKGEAQYFDETDLENLWRIRIYKQLNYKNIDIHNALFKNKDHLNGDNLQTQIDKLIEQKEELEQIINVAAVMKDTGLTPGAIRFGVIGMEHVPYNVAFFLLNKFNDADYIEDGECSVYDELDENLLGEVLENLSNLRNQGVVAAASEAQTQIGRLYEHFAETCGSSRIQFSVFFTGFYPDTEGGIFIDKELGKGFAGYLAAAIKHFVQSYENRTLDDDFVDALDTIHELACKKYTTSSAEVQDQVCRIHNYIRDLGFKSDRSQIIRLRHLSSVYNSDVMRKSMDGGAKRGIAWFLSRAIEIYCNALEKPETIE